MRKLASISLAAVALLLAVAAPSQARSRGGFHHHRVFHGGARVFIGVGPAFWWGPYPYGYYPPPYYAYYPPPTVVVQEQPPVYIQRQPGPLPVPAPPADWYYCASARAYYPTVQACPEAWIRVPARTQ